ALDGDHAFDPVIAQQAAETVARAYAVSRHHDPPAGSLLLADLRPDGVEQRGPGPVANRGEVLARLGSDIEDVGTRPGGLRKRRECAYGPRAQGRRPVLVRQIEMSRRQWPVWRPLEPSAARHVAASLVVLVYLGEPGRNGFIGLMVERNSRPWGIVEQSFQPIMEQRQPVL